MENNNNKEGILSDGFIKSQTIFRDMRISNFKLSKLNFKTSKDFNIPNQMSKNKSDYDIRHGYFFKLKASKNVPKVKSIKEKCHYNSNILKRDLSVNRKKLQKKKDELSLLKIEYNKLDEDNMNNKILISHILSIIPHKISKEKLNHKINNCKLTKEDRKKLENAHTIIKLKLELLNKKKEIAKNNDIIEELQKNSRTKIISEYENEYKKKCKQQKNLLNTLKKVEERYNFYENKVNEINEIIQNESINNNILIKQEYELIKTIQKNEEIKKDIIIQISQLEDKIKKKEMINNDREKDIKKIERRINKKEEELHIIKEYKNKRNEDIKTIEEKKKSKEEIEKIIKEQDKQIQDLSNILDKLNQKIIYHLYKKQKLTSKEKEKEREKHPDKELEKINLLKQELDSLLKEKEETEKKSIEKQNELKNISEELNMTNEKNKENIDKNNIEKEALNKKIEELKIKIRENDEKGTNINNEQKNLNENVTKKEEQNILDELDILKKEQITLNNENSKLIQDNKNYKDVLEVYNKDLEDYDNIENQLKEAKEKLDSLKSNK